MVAWGLALGPEIPILRQVRDLPIYIYTCSYYLFFIFVFKPKVIIQGIRDRQLLCLLDESTVDASISLLLIKLLGRSISLEKYVTKST